jgi:hypothetical protein
LLLGGVSCGSSGKRGAEWKIQQLPLELFYTRQDFPAEQFNCLHHFPMAGAGVLETQVYHTHTALVMERL